MGQVMNFRIAFDSLKKRDASIAREVITKRCEWGSQQLFYMKMRGARGIKEGERVIIESVFRSVGLDAWTGKELVTA